MITNTLMLDIIHDFQENPKYKFSIVELNEFEDMNQKCMWLSLKLEDWRYQEGMNLQIVKSDIKKRISNLLGLDRLILYFDINFEKLYLNK